jgi:hypothetical protein
MWGKFSLMIAVVIVAIAVVSTIMRQYQQSARKKRVEAKQKRVAAPATSTVPGERGVSNKEPIEALLRKVQDSPTAKISLLCKLTPSAASKTE